ncbi:nuclear transport factor 2 family protein [Mesorhizobium sp. M1227]|uniref:nuclear transport factor 2 family protein n=1 Tax=Mesorhizobium sp. M1227 TaxID=2957071 RepID=UPI0033355C75
MPIKPSSAAISICSGDLTQLADIVSQDYGDKLNEQSSGIDVIRGYLEGLKSSFPDFTWTIEQIIGEGDRVAVMSRVSGTQVKMTSVRSRRPAIASISLLFNSIGSPTESSPSTGR